MAKSTIDGRDLTGRAAAIAREVWISGATWVAFDQGRLAHALGQDKAINPFPRPRPDLGVGAIDHARFEEGWEYEAALCRRPMDIPRAREALEAHRAAIGRHRDALRDLQGDIEALAESAARAFESLDDAIDALSELA
jgi:hypothetical protein